MGTAGITQNLQAVGNYRIASLLSFNEIAATFQGFDHDNNLPSAIVAVHESSLADPEAWNRFRGLFEPLINAGASRVCQSYSCGHDSSHYWASYEWLRGNHLGILVRDNGLPEQVETLEWMAQLCDAIGILHSRGVVHRILSPASIFINDFNQVKLLHAAWGEMILHVSGGLINPAFGSILPFTAPEVVSGQKADESADVYSIGANLFFLLTGQPVFWHDNPSTLADLIRTQKPDVSILRGEVSPELIEILEEVLAHDPSDRPINLPALSGRLRALSQAAFAATQSAEEQEPPTFEEQQDDDVPPQIAPTPLGPEPYQQEQPVETEEGPRGLPPRMSSSQEEVPLPDGSSGGEVYSDEEAGEPIPETGESPSQRSGLHDVIEQRRQAVVQRPAPGEEAAASPVAISPSKPGRGKLVLLMALLGIVLLAAIGVGGFAAYQMLLSPPPPQPVAEADTDAGADTIYQDYLSAREELRVLGNWNRAFYRANGRWALSLEELQEVGAKEAEFLDPWENTMEVRGSFVVSPGRDGIWDNDDDPWYDAEESEVGGFMPNPSAGNE